MRGGSGALDVVLPLVREVVGRGTTVSRALRSRGRSLQLHHRTVSLTLTSIRISSASTPPATPQSPPPPLPPAPQTPP